jgi:PKD repeat protein
MKRFLFLAALTSLLLSRCHVDPHADFSISSSSVEPGVDVYFTNLSTDADSYSWDFGDGYNSYDVSPVHYYDAEGTYTISLTASHHGGGSDVAQQTIDVHYLTDLEITVAEWNSNYIVEYIVPNASVRLYPSLSDWDNQTNMVAEGTTDSHGVVTFSGLDPVKYYVDVYATHYNNYSIRNDLPQLIVTAPLIKGNINTFIAWADYVTSKSQEAGRNLVQTAAIYQSKRTINNNKSGK